jgi:hypothetical protein
VELDDLSVKERERIIEKLRVTAIAAADLWDICSQIEEAHGFEIGFETDWVEALGGLCDSPASNTKWGSGELWELFVSFSTVTQV